MWELLNLYALSALTFLQQYGAQNTYVGYVFHEIDPLSILISHRKLFKKNLVDPIWADWQPLSPFVQNNSNIGLKIK